MLASNPPLLLLTPHIHNTPTYTPLPFSTYSTIFLFLPGVPSDCSYLYRLAFITMMTTNQPGKYLFVPAFCHNLCFFLRILHTISLK
ncbi:hypothetical protein BP00DRAFT_110598 [Aspergillus indologenus CBS 114.80]|uniref:Uncharacterized protein n=1 Tax=Aspergillus indologenus CBS 114.80 TaxID=1450541 RepID=A0A2V5JCD5_9EURO|nr:hypothetical protein BP00DRAFT_110598 [Aspergillus indologenus CBS 114.80]